MWHTFGRERHLLGQKMAESIGEKLAIKHSYIRVVLSTHIYTHHQLKESAFYRLIFWLKHSRILEYSSNHRRQGWGKRGCGGKTAADREKVRRQRDGEEATRSPSMQQWRQVGATKGRRIQREIEGWRKMPEMRRKQGIGRRSGGERGADLGEKQREMVASETCSCWWLSSPRMRGRKKTIEA